MNGYKTYLVAVLMAVLPALSTWLGGVDWAAVIRNAGVPDAFVVPLAGLVSALIMVVMRKLTEITTVREALNTEPPAV